MGQYCLVKSTDWLLCVNVCVRPFIVKASSAWISWNAREQTNDVTLKTFFPMRYFRMNQQTFLASHIILFTH